ncbi:MAG: zinc-ribbon domain-containing protein [Euryarchaeota archaeon]|nr:zinc-ribbon domain-containing protein [Euryarchaeota archaeon]
MAYCSRCGNHAKEGAQFCDRCGAQLSGGQQQYGQPPNFTHQYYPERKDPLIALILSILLPGVGQIYVGRVLRGLLILLLVPLFSVFPAILMFAVVSTGSVSGALMTGVVLVIVSIALYIWQIVDAYRLAEEHNRHGSPLRY